MEGTRLRTLILSAFVGLALIAYCIPTDLEMASLRFRSQQAGEAEFLLKKIIETKFQNGRAMRNLVDVLEYEGRIDEALLLMRQLVLLHPKNENYQNRLLGLLLENERFEEYWNKRLEILPASESQAAETISDLLWSGTQKQYLEYFERIYRKSPLGRENRLAYSRALSQSERWKQAEEVILADPVLADRDQLAFDFNRDRGDPRRAFYFWKKNWGLEFKGGGKFELQADFLKKIKESPAQFEDSLWWIVTQRENLSSELTINELVLFLEDFSYKFQKQSWRETALQICFKSKLLQNARALLERWEIQLKGNDWNSWRLLAKYYIQAGVPARASRILKAILNQKDPRVDLKSSSLFWHKIDSWIHKYVFSEAIASTLPRRWNKKESIERSQDYWQLVESFDAAADSKQSVQTLYQFWNEIKSGALRLGYTDKVKVLSALTSHLIWISQFDEVLRLASSIEKYSSETSEKNLALARKELSQSHVESQVQTMKDKLRAVIQKWEGQHTPDFTSASMDVSTQIPLSHQSPWSFTLNAQGLAFVDLDHAQAQSTVGLRYDANQGNWGFQLDAGYRSGFSKTYLSPYHPKANASLFGSPWGFTYIIVGLNGAKALAATREQARYGISESQAFIYAERRISPWVDLAFEAATRRTHEGSDLNAGAGSEIGARIGIGPSTWFLNPGAWGYFVRWSQRGSHDELSNVMLRRSTLAGPRFLLQFQPNQNPLWKIRLDSGWGFDLSATDDQHRWENAYTEFSLEHPMGNNWSIDLRYSYYTSRVSGATGTQIGSFSLKRLF